MVKQGYKQTEIGVIPEDWEVMELGEVFDLKQGVQIGVENQFFTEKIGLRRFIRIIDLTQADTPPRFVSLENYIGALISDEDLFMVRYGASAGTIGINYNGILANNLFKLIPKKIIKSHFFKFQFQDIYDKIQEMSGSSAMPALNFTSLKKLPLVLPPLAEQEAIATALSDADAGIERLEKLIAKKRLIKQGAMQELLTPKEDWEVKKFDKIFIRIASKKYQINSNEYNEIGRYPIIDQGQQKIVGYSDREDKVFDLKNIIIFGDHTRIIKYVDFPFIVGADGVQLLSSQNENVKFLYYLLSSYDIPNTGYNRHFKYLKDFDYFIPSLPEQERIATILSDMDAELEALEKQLGKARQIKQGMMQELLTGRIRL